MDDPNAKFNSIVAMPPLTDVALLKCFRNALANWRYEGFLVLTDVAQHWLKFELPGITVRDLGRHLYQFIAAGGIIDQQKETRPEWSTYDFHFDFRIPLKSRLLYIETRLACDHPDDPDDPVIN